MARHGFRENLIPKKKKLDLHKAILYLNTSILVYLVLKVFHMI